MVTGLEQETLEAYDFIWKNKYELRFGSCLFAHKIKDEWLVTPDKRNLSPNWVYQVRKRIQEWLGDCVPWMLTLTLPSWLWNRSTDLQSRLRKDVILIRSEWNLFLTRLRRVWPKSLEYSWVAVLELTKDLRPHLHILFREFPTMLTLRSSTSSYEFVLSYHWLRKMWFSKPIPGKVHLSMSTPFDSQSFTVESAVNYLGQYLSKSQKYPSVTKVLIKECGIKLFSYSRGAIKPLHKRVTKSKPSLWEYKGSHTSIPCSIHGSGAWVRSYSILTGEFYNPILIANGDSTIVLNKGRGKNGTPLIDFRSAYLYSRTVTELHTEGFCNVLESSQESAE